MDIKCDSDSDTNSRSIDNVLSYNGDLEIGGGEKLNDELDISDSPLSNRKLPLIKEDSDEL